MKHFKHKHDTRYKAALARITPAREADTRARVAKELPEGDKAQVERLVAHKLGRRVQRIPSNPQLGGSE